MTDRGALAGGVAVLERAVAYALGSLALVTPPLLPRPTPCSRWDLRDLLDHLGDSMTALQEAADQGHVPLTPPDGPDGLIPAVRDRAITLLGAWANATRPAVAIEDTPAPAPLIAGVGAIEVTVHGWDVARACGELRPIPADLADELLDLSAVLVRPSDRPGRFGRPLPAAAGAGPSDRLLAFLGRAPGPGIV